MTGLRRHLTLTLVVVMATLGIGSSQFLWVSSTAAQTGPEASKVSPQPERPFQLPFAKPSGLNTWLLAQPYGNTTSAYRQRFTTYGASGGIHFGMDLSAPCGTEISAIADGVVFAVDGPFGSAPHNLMIDHPQLGYASMYGHLLKAPDLSPGQVVKQGQVVAYSGDPAGTCYGRPHLHLEIRDLKHVTKYDPLTLIAANWDDLALFGNAGRDFARDLEEPRKWQSLYDQPQARTGGPILNDFDYPWPFEWGKRKNSTLVPPRPVITASLVAQSLQPETLSTLPIGYQLTTGDCCTQPYWSNDSTQVRFIDQPRPNASLGIWAVDVNKPAAGPQFVTDRLGIYSPDQAFVAYPGQRANVVVVERLADGQTWEINTQGHSLSFTPDSRHVTWTVSNDNTFDDNREAAMWLANVDGSQARVLFRARQTNPVGWLATDKLLMTRRIPRSTDQELSILSVTDGKQTDLFQLPQMRGLAFSPNRRYLVYYVSFQAQADKNGLWLLDLQSPKPVPQKLPFFGAYRWRDNGRLIYVPFDPAATEHNFYEYDLRTQQTRPLFPAGTSLLIANNDWQVSPDGSKIVLVATKDTTLDGLWVLDLGQN